MSESTDSADLKIEATIDGRVSPSLAALVPVAIGVMQRRLPLPAFNARAFDLYGRRERIKISVECGGEFDGLRLTLSMHQPSSRDLNFQHVETNYLLAWSDLMWSNPAPANAEDILRRLEMMTGHMLDDLANRLNCWIEVGGDRAPDVWRLKN